MKLRKNINETDSQTYDEFNETFDTLYDKLKYPFRKVLDKTQIAILIKMMFTEPNAEFGKLSDHVG